MSVIEKQETRFGLAAIEASRVLGPKINLVGCTTVVAKDDVTLLRFQQYRGRLQRMMKLTQAHRKSNQLG